MTSRRAWGLFVLAAVTAAVNTGGCATATPFDGTLDEDSGTAGDDAAGPALDAAKHTDSSTAHQDSAVVDNDAAPGMDASVGIDSSVADTGMAPDTATVVDTGTPDTATTGCSAQSVVGYTPVFVPPVPKSIKCTTTASTAIFNGCLGAASSQAACTNAATLYSACYGCIFTNDTASSWGPVINVSNGIARINEGGCIQLADASQSTCAHSVESSNGCEDKACKAACPVTDNTSFTLYQSCVSSADTGGCSTYSSTANTCINAIPISSAAYNCVRGATFQALYNNVVPVFCGP